MGLADELPKTAVGKVFKPELRRRALERVYAEALAAAGVTGEVRAVDDPVLGVVAEVRPDSGEAARGAVASALDAFPRPWRIVEEAASPAAETARD